MKTKIVIQRGIHSRRATAGFSRTDLIAVLSAGCLLALVLLTTAATSATRSRYAICLNNHKQLVRAWLVYADDNGGKLVGNLDGANSMNLSNSNRTWVLGWFDFSGGSPSGANTNSLLLTQFSPLALYAGRTAGVFKCPTDRSLSRGTTGAPRVRSVSMNSYLGERSGPFTSGYRIFRRITELNSPLPSRTSVFLDEREDSINEGWFAVNMTGYDPRNPGSCRWVDYSADWHDGAGNLSFADGHTETWRWRDPRTRPTHRFGQLLPLNVASPNNVDVARLQEVTSRRIK